MQESAGGLEELVETMLRLGVENSHETGGLCESDIV